MPPEREADPSSQMPYDQYQTLQQNHKMHAKAMVSGEEAKVEISITVAFFASDASFVQRLGVRVARVTMQ
jgi:hypothetical protein